MKKFLKIILLSLNVLVVLLLLGSTMGGWMRPSKFMLFSFLGYGYLYLAIANAVFIILWLCFSSKWFLLSLAALLARVTFLPLYFQVGGTEDIEAEIRKQDNCVKVMTFNVHHFQGVEMIRSLADTNMLLFLEMVDDEEPDVLVLQEYVGAGDTVRLTEALRRRGFTEQASGHAGGSMTGEVIFSKLPLLNVSRIKEPTLFYADLLYADDTLRVCCMHLDSYGLDESDHRQIHDIRRGVVDSSTGRGTYHKFKETILKHEEEWGILDPFFATCRLPLIVAGDFNDPPASFFYQQCRQYLKDSYCEVGQGFSTTYHGTFTHRRNAIFPAFRIDMVLHSASLQARSYKRLKSEISDHYPVIVTLSLNPTDNSRQ